MFTESPTQYLLNVGPESPKLVSIYSTIISSSCRRNHMHIQRGTLLQTTKWKYLLISQVCILQSFGRDVAGTAANSEIEVSAYFTGVHIIVFWKGCDRHSCRQRNGSIFLFHKCVYTMFCKDCDSKKRVQRLQRKGSIILDIEVSTYSLLATLLHAGHK